MSQQAQDKLKSFTPADCPHCKKTIYVVHNFSYPSIQSVITDGEVKQAKQAVLNQLDDIAFNDEGEKKMTKQWIEADETIFSLAEVETIISSIRISQLERDTKSDATPQETDAA